jgi:hypothetical protein
VSDFTRSPLQAGARMRGNVRAIREQTCVQLAKYALILHTGSLMDSARSLVLMLHQASYRISSESAMYWPIVPPLY